MSARTTRSTAAIVAALLPLAPEERRAVLNAALVELNTPLALTKPGPEADAALVALRARPGVTARELAAELGKTLNGTSTLLWRLKARGLADNPKHGRWVATEDV